MPHSCGGRHGRFSAGAGRCSAGIGGVARGRASARLFQVVLDGRAGEQEEPLVAELQQLGT